MGARDWTQDKDKFTNFYEMARMIKSIFTFYIPLEVHVYGSYHDTPRHVIRK